MRRETTTRLLADLQDPANDGAWREFDARYRPIVTGFARALGLEVDDSADVAQETLVRFAAGYREGRYDRSRGRLHSWLIGIAQNCIGQMWDKRARRKERRGLSAIASLPDRHRLTEIWDSEYQRYLLDKAMVDLRTESRMDPRTIRAFERLVFDQESARDVAHDMDMTLNDVYLAKHRCLKQLRTILSQLRETFDCA
jgi:RNA polymerase sigma factor (sigma-70 family)